MFIKAAALALGASAVLASPLQRRQANITSSGAGTTTSLVNATNTASVQSSVTSAISSAISSAVQNTTSAPAPTSTGASNSTGSGTYTGCPAGYSLTYAIGVNEYPAIPITQAYNVLEDWGNAIPPPIQRLSSNGTGVGATRSWTIQNITVEEVLTNVTANASTGYLDQMWNLSAPITVSPSVIISNATTDLTLYANSTSNVTTVQFYVNFCTSDQAAGLTLYAELVTAYLNGLNALFTTGTGGGSGNITSSASSSSRVSSSASATSSRITSAASSIASGVSSSLIGGSGVQGPGASSVFSAATSGAGGAISTAISGGSSIVGDVTSALLPTSA